MALGLTPKEIIDSGRHPLLECSNEWERIELKKIADVQNGYAFKSEYFNHETGIPLIRIRDVGKRKTDELYSGDFDDDYLVNKGDILIGMDGDFRAAYWIGEPGLLNQRVCRVRNIDESYSKKFLFYLLQPYLEAIHAETSAVTVKHLSSRTIQSIPLPNPPLTTQHRIVEKIEELFSDLEHGVENLKKAQKQLKTYRQAVLKDAFEGKLTKEWRKQQDDLPTPEELLEQIKTERKAHRQCELDEWEKEVGQWKKAGEPGRKPRKPRKQKRPDKFIDKELEDLPKLPAKWIWMKMGDLVQTITKGSSPSWQGFEYVNDSSELLFITSENVRNNYLLLDEPKYLEMGFNDKQNRSSLKKGDLLFNIVGASIGRAALFDLNKESNINQAVALIRLLPVLNKKLISYYLNTSFLESMYQGEIVDVARANLSLTDIGNFVVPVTSMAEQEEVLNEIESRLSVVDQLEQTIKENLQKAEALRQSILKKAFSGGLVK